MEPRQPAAPGRHTPRPSAAGAARDAARQTLADLRSQRADPQTLRSQADAAGAAHALAAAAVEVAQANLDVVAGRRAARSRSPRPRPSVDQADAALAALQARRAQARIVAPRAGTVTSVVAPGRRSGRGRRDHRATGRSERGHADGLRARKRRSVRWQLGGLTRDRRRTRCPGRVITGTVTTHRRPSRVHPEERADPRGTHPTWSLRSMSPWPTLTARSNPGCPRTQPSGAAADCGPTARHGRGR